jgi:hypothetical protein
MPQLRGNEPILGLNIPERKVEVVDIWHLNLLTLQII